MKKYQVAISGMKCMHCVGKVQKALSGLEGVAAAEVALDPGAAVVEGNVSAGAIREAVEGLGFSVQSIEEAQR